MMSNSKASDRSPQSGRYSIHLLLPPSSQVSWTTIRGRQQCERYEWRIWTHLFTRVTIDPFLLLVLERSAAFQAPVTS
jgi:hypothetical protein